MFMITQLQRHSSRVLPHALISTYYSHLQQIPENPSKIPEIPPVSHWDRPLSADGGGVGISLDGEEETGDGRGEGGRG